MFICETKWAKTWDNAIRHPADQPLQPKSHMFVHCLYNLFCIFNMILAIRNPGWGQSLAGQLSRPTSPGQSSWWRVCTLHTNSIPWFLWQGVFHRSKPNKQCLLNICLISVTPEIELSCMSFTKKLKCFVAFASGDGLKSNCTYYTLPAVKENSCTMFA